MRHPDLTSLLIDRPHVDRSPGRRAIREAVASGDVIKVHHGWYAQAATLADVFSEERHMARVLAVGRSMRGSAAVFSHFSAGVLHGLPLFRMSPHRVHMTAPGEVQSPSSTKIMRHRDVLPAGDVAEQHGLRCTSLARTIIDIARAAPIEVAIAAADAAMRQIAWDDQTLTYDQAAAERFRQELWTRIFAMTGRRGIRQARTVAELADGRAQLPGESVSRLYLLNLGFSPRIQVEVAAPGDGRYFVDFGLDEVGYWGEFDGMGKYTDPDMTGGRSVEEVLRAQDARQAWITETTGRPFARWGSEHIDSELTLYARLASFGVFAPRPAATVAFLHSRG